MSTRVKHILAVLIILAAVCAVFSPLCGYDFIILDDNIYVYENPHIRDGLTLSGLLWAFGADLFFGSHHADYWQPVTFISRMIDMELYGTWAGGHHLTNVILHAINALLIFGLFSTLTGAVLPSAFVALLFAVHPLQVQPVAWVTARKDVLSGFFTLLTIWAYVYYIRSPSRKRNVAVGFLFALALMSKPSVVTVPLLLLVLDIWPLGRINAGALGVREIRPRIVEKKYLLLLAFASCLTGCTGHTTMNFIPQACLQAPAIYLHHLEQIFYPVTLLMTYPVRQGYGAVLTLFSFALIAGLTAFFFRVRERRPYLLAGWLWFLIALLPMMGLFPENRFTYLALIGIFIIPAWGLTGSIRTGKTARVLLLSASIALVGASMARAGRQIRLWKDSVTLFTHDVDAVPDNWAGHLGLGLALVREGEIDASVAHFSEAVRITPDHADAQNNLGNILQKIGRPEEALAHYKKALEENPRHAKAHNNLGSALFMLDKPRQALAHYETALALEPDYADAHFNLGRALARTGNGDRAVEHFYRAVQIDPNLAAAHKSLATLLAKRGMLDRARLHFAQALTARPDDFEIYNNLGLMAAAEDRLDEAVAYYDRALDLNPDSAEIRSNLGNAFLNLDQTAKAIESYREALRQNPDYAPAKHNLDIALSHTGKNGD